MVVGIGVDVVNVVRFKHFYSYSHKQLRRIFSAEEIRYCLSNLVKSPERFAVRFAAKEALYKALTQAHNAPPCTFLELCANVEIVLHPFPAYCFHELKTFLSHHKILLTMSHTDTLAIAHAIVMY